MKISSLDELKTKVGHVIVMILLVKMFERSKMVTISTGMDLLSYSVCIFLSSASLYILHNLHRPEQGFEIFNRKKNVILVYALEQMFLFQKNAYGVFGSIFLIILTRVV